MLSILKQPKHQMIFSLILLLCAASLKLGILESALLAAQCVGFTVLSDLVVTLLRRRSIFLPRSGIITGLILTLIIDPSASWYQIALIGFAAMAIKNLVRPGGKHIFNPAASGLAVGWLIFKLQPSWWAPSPLSPTALFSLSNLLIFIPILLMGYISLYRYRRYNSAASYGVTTLVGSFVVNRSAAIGVALFSVLNFGTIFYAFLMLVEPMTSPINKKKQLFYGATVALITLFLVYIQKTMNLTFFDATLTALLLGNLIFFTFR